MARGRPTVAFIADITRHALTGKLITEPEIDLRAPSMVMDKLDELEKHYREQLKFVEITLAPRVIRVVDGHSMLQLGTSNYARFMAAAEIFGSHAIDDQRRELSRYSIGTPPWFAHSLGVNCSLETADGKLVWTIRPTNSLEGDLIAPVMGEGARLDDVVDGMWSPETTARRGFHEELGFPIASADTLRLAFHSAVAQFGSGGHSISGHAISTLTLEEILEQHEDAIDANEHVNGIYVCDANAESLEAFLDAHPLDKWTTWGTSVLWDLATHHLNVKIDGLELQPIESPAIA
jgi:hypothetical protein